jgi:autotransporter-associated beta strand protein
MKIFCVLLLILTAILPLASPAQVSLTGTNYSQDFNSLGSGLPTGWTTRLGVSTTNIGTPLSFTNTSSSSSINNWSDTSGAFKNYASATGLVSNSTTAAQQASTNRALGITPTGTFGDVGTNYAAFVLQLSNTTGFQDFNLSMDAMVLSSQTRTNVWTLDYGIGASPTSFTTLTNWTTPADFGTTTLSISSASLSGIANLSDNVWFRFTLLTPSTGSGSRDRIGIDNFSLTYTVAAGTEYFWTANGSTLGGASTWDTSGTTWSSATNPVSGIAWDSSKKAVFSGTAASVTVDSISASKGVQFVSTGYLLNGGTLTLSGVDSVANSITTDSGVTAEISSTLAGTTGMTKSGAGTLVLSGSNTFSGNATIAAGTLHITNDSALGNTANDLINNGTLKTTANVSLDAGRAISGSGTYDIANGTTLTINGFIANTATTLANTGILSIQNATNSLGAVTFNAAGTIEGVAAINATGLTASGLTSGTATINPDIIFTSGDKTLNVAAGGAVDLNGALSNGGGTGRIAKTGSGTLILSGANNMGGLRVGATAASPTDGGTVVLENSAIGTIAQAIQHNYGTLQAASSLVFTNGISIGGRTNGAALLAGSNMEFQGQSAFFRGTGTSGQLVLNVDNTTTFSGGFAATSGGGTATGITIGGAGMAVISGVSTNLVDAITLTDTAKLRVNSSLGSTNISVGSGAAIGGNGTIAGSMSLAAGAGFMIFDLNAPLTVVGSVSLDNTFSIASLLGAEGNLIDWSTIADGTYTLISNASNFSNIQNFGSGNKTSIGGDRFAYFSEGSLQLNVVPEPSTYALLALTALGLAGHVIRRRRR